MEALGCKTPHNISDDLSEIDMLQIWVGLFDSLKIVPWKIGYRMEKHVLGGYDQVYLDVFLQWNGFTFEVTSLCFRLNT